MHPNARLAVPLLAVSMALIAGTLTAAAQPITGAGRPAVSAAGLASATASPQAVRWVTLVTGNRVAVITGPGGRESAVALSPRGTSDRLITTLRLGGDLYVIPHAALSKIGTAYSLQDFNVSRLLRSGPAQGAPAAGRMRARPDFPMQTLTVRGIDPYGRPASGGLLTVINVDNARKFFSGFMIFYKGQARLSVPAGHYEALAQFEKQDTSGNIAAVDTVMLPQFTIRSGMPAQITIDARTATSLVSAATPRPADQAGISLGIDRQDGAGNDLAYTSGWTGTPQPAFYVTPTRPVTVGSLVYESYLTLLSPATATPYRYDLVFPSEGVIPRDQRHRVTVGQLATVAAQYPSEDPGRPESLGRFSQLPGSLLSVNSFRFFTAPFRETDYLSTRPVVWSDLFDIHDPSTGSFVGNDFFSSYYSYRPGARAAQQWLKEPIVPGVAVKRGPWPANGGTGLNAGGFICGACRQGDTLNFLIFPFTDTSANYAGDSFSSPGLTESATYALSSDGNQVSSGSLPFTDALSFPVSAARATYQLVYDTVRSDPPLITLSAATQTVWTFSSSHQSAGQLPAGWQCAPGSTPSRACTILPLLFARYDLPVSLSGQEKAGPAQFTLKVAHIQDGPTTQVAIPGVQVSFDGGTTWTAATVTQQSPGQFTVSYTNPPASQGDGYAALQITAQDAAGSQIDQTIQRAYAVSG